MSVTAILRDHLVSGGIARVYPLGAVPASPTYPYVVVGYAPAAPAVRTLDGSGDPADRFTVQIFGRTDDSVEDVAADMFNLLDAKPLPLPDAPVCEQLMASSIYRDPNTQGVLNVLHTYRF